VKLDVVVWYIHAALIATGMHQSVHLLHAATIQTTLAAIVATTIVPAKAGAQHIFIDYSIKIAKK